MKGIIYRNARRFERKPTCHMYYVTTSNARDPDDNLVSAKETIVSDVFDDLLFSDVTFSFIGGDKLYKMYKNITGSTENEISIEHYIVIPEAEEGQEAILGRLSCKELIKLISDESGIIDKNIFTDNIRDFMGATGVNTEISNTIRDESNKKYFMLFNNGITAVAKKVHREKNKLRIENIQIVNGCQTSNILYNNRGYISDEMHLSIKIVATQNQDIINSIIRSTNRQNTVPPEAFESLEEFHRKFEDFCRLTNRYVKDNIYYERRSRQYVSNEKVKPLEIVTLSGLLSSNMSMYFDEPHSVHRYYGELLKANKSRVFLETHKLEPYYFAAYCQHKLVKLLRQNPRCKRYSIAKYHALMNIWKLLASGKRYNLNSNDIAADIMKKYLLYIEDERNFTDIAAKSVALFYKTAQHANVGAENIARSKVVTEAMINSISPTDYLNL